MKRLTIFVMLCILLSCLSVCVQASQLELDIDDVTADPGETIYMQVKLSGSAIGNAMAITFDYDKTVLELVESACTWEKEGVIEDFDTERNAGVWTDAQAVDVKGLVCTLAFRVISKEEYYTSEVTCVLTVKNGTELIGKYEAQATVSAKCLHQYGPWNTIGEVGHSRSCLLCERKQTQSHHFGEAVEEKDSSRPNIVIKVYTCEECKTQKRFEQFADQEPTIPTIPEDRPDDPVTDLHPTVPTFPFEEDSDHDHDHSHTTFPTSGNSSIKPTTGENSDHDHDHSSSSTRLNIKAGGVLAFWGIFGAMILGAVLYLKKRK